MFGGRIQGLPDIFHLKRIKNADVSYGESLLAVIEDRAGSAPFDFQCLKTVQSPEEIGGKRPGGLDLDRDEFAFFPDEQVDLVAVGVSKKIDLRPDPPVEGALQNFGDDEILVQIPPQGIARGLFLRCVNNKFNI